METPVKGRRGWRKILFTAVLSVAIISALLLVSSYILFKSPSFVSLVERVLTSKTGHNVTIGSITLAEGPAVVIKETVIKDGVVPIATIPQVAVGLSLGGFFKGRVERITITGPEIFFEPGAGGGVVGKGGEGTPLSIPDFFKEIVVQDGYLRVSLEKQTPFTAGPVNIRLAASGGGKARLKGDIFLPAFGSTVSIETGLDLKRLAIDRGRIDMGLIELKDLKTGGLWLRGAGEIKGTLKTEINLVKRDGGLGVEFTGVLKGISLGKGKLTALEGTSGSISAALILDKGFRSAALKATLDLKTPTMGKVEALFKGSYDLETKDLLISEASLRSPVFGSALMDGKLHAFPSRKAEIDLRLKAAIKEFPANEIKGIVHGVKGMAGLSIKGSLSAGLTVKGTVASPIVRGELRMAAQRLKTDTLEARAVKAIIPMGYGPGGFFIKGASVKGGRVKAVFNKAYNADIKGFEVTLLALKYTGGAIGPGGFRLRIKSAAVKDKAGEIVREEEISVTGRIEGDAERRLFHLRDLSFRSGSFSGESRTVSIDLSGPVKAEAEIDLKTPQIARFRPQISRFLPEGITVNGGATIHSSLRATLGKGGSAKISGETAMSLTGGGFSSADGVYACEGITMRVSSGFDITLPALKAGFNVKMEARGFELLAGGFYGDFSARPLTLSARGEYTGEDDALNIEEAELRLGDMAKILLKGKAEDIGGSPVFHAGVELKKLLNKEAYDLFIRETFQETLPILSRLDLDGSSSLSISAEGTLKGFHVVGGIFVKDADIIGKRDNIEVKGININLPVDISYPSPGGVLGSPKKFGSLKIKEISRGAIKVGGITAAPALWRNSLRFRDDITLSLFNGAVTLKDAAYRDLLTPERNLTMKVAVDGIDLKEAGFALGLPPFGGDLSGSIPKVTLADNKLLTDGVITLKVFGGRVRIKEIAVDDILSPAAALKASVQIEDIDLGKLTGAFEFGDITGILEGYVRDLTIVNGQPETFTASIETVKRRGVSQRISTTALEKISILGSGATASVLNRGIYRLFNEYRYKKMGFRGRLKNDRLLLLGVETIGDKGYIIKGGLLPPKVDVISYTNTISFKEMVKRIKRVRQIGNTGP